MTRSVWGPTHTPLSIARFGYEGDGKAAAPWGGQREGSSWPAMPYRAYPIPAPKDPMDTYTGPAPDGLSGITSFIGAALSGPVQAKWTELKTKLQSMLGRFLQSKETLDNTIATGQRLIPLLEARGATAEAARARALLQRATQLRVVQESLEGEVGAAASRVQQIQREIGGDGNLGVLPVAAVAVIVAGLGVVTLVAGKVIVHNREVGLLKTQMDQLASGSLSASDLSALRGSGSGGFFGSFAGLGGLLAAGAAAWFFLR